MFSLFVAVLLVNFAVDEDDKMPRQKVKYDREEAHKKAHPAHSSIASRFTAASKSIYVMKTTGNSRRSQGNIEDGIEITSPRCQKSDEEAR